MARKIIEEEISTLSLSDFSGNILDVIKMLSDIYTGRKDEYISLRIDASQCYEDVEISLLGTRPENDKEYNIRLAAEKKKAEAKALRLAKATERAALKQKQHEEAMKKIAREAGLPETTDLKALKEYLNSQEGI